jgi:hypothetical protein
LYYFEDVGVDGGIILKINIEEKGGVTWTGLISAGIGTDDRLL